ncbi:hypothetical protein FISHEDRAFT_58422 [Fistulina hepatica ATCC 64428]|nr:hypothetical protein FISHEDRAFT_58422 [Fistulina hepatica ATCC 64428]
MPQRPNANASPVISPSAISSKPREMPSSVKHSSEATTVPVPAAAGASNPTRSIRKSSGSAMNGPSVSQPPKPQTASSASHGKYNSSPRHGRHAASRAMATPAAVRGSPKSGFSQPPPMHNGKQTAAKQVPQKKTTRRASQPIINWLQRKWGGTGRGKRTENLLGDHSPRERPVPPKQASNCAVPSPLPSPHSEGANNTVSLNGDSIISRDYNSVLDADDRDDVDSCIRSVWSPTSAMEADEDASLRPLPPSSPPSPSPSRSSSSYMSDPRTFRSMTASTKPTTLLSIDLNGGGMAHIAQAPNTPLRHVSHTRSSSVATSLLMGGGGSITFSTLPPSSSPSSAAAAGVVHAPLHTTHHPRNNPRPSSPPLDNASVLTLASSAYAIPGLRGAFYTSVPPSALGADSAIGADSVSIAFPDGESASQITGADEERLEDRDFDASVRALRPRSSRRGSWESEVSRWSARILGPGTPSLAREKSVWTTNSAYTGAVSDHYTFHSEDEPRVALPGNFFVSFHFQLVTNLADADDDRKMDQLDEEDSLSREDGEKFTPSFAVSEDGKPAPANTQRGSEDVIPSIANELTTTPRKTTVQLADDASPPVPMSSDAGHASIHLTKDDTEERPSLDTLGNGVYVDCPKFPSTICEEAEPKPDCDAESKDVSFPSSG